MQNTCRWAEVRSAGWRIRPHSSKHLATVRAQYEVGEPADTRAASAPDRRDPPSPSKSYTSRPRPGSARKSNATAVGVIEAGAVPQTPSLSAANLKAQSKKVPSDTSAASSTTSDSRSESTANSESRLTSPITSPTGTPSQGRKGGNSAHSKGSALQKGRGKNNTAQPTMAPPPTTIEPAPPLVPWWGVNPQLEQKIPVLIQAGNPDEARTLLRMCAVEDSPFTQFYLGVTTGMVDGEVPPHAWRCRPRPTRCGVDSGMYRSSLLLSPCSLHALTSPASLSSLLINAGRCV